MSSVEGLQVERHNFDHDDYVLIRVDIGKMPPHTARNYIKRLREETALCKMLDERNIRFDLVGVRDNSGSGLKIKRETSSSGSNNVAIGHAAMAEVSTGSGMAKAKLMSPLESETLPELGESIKETMDDIDYFRQNAMKSLAIANTLKKAEGNNVVVADRNDILKANDLADELKTDSFADAMRLLDD